VLRRLILLRLCLCLLLIVFDVVELAGWRALFEEEQDEEAEEEEEGSS
jgi:hypothetical protein